MPPWALRLANRGVASLTRVPRRPQTTATRAQRARIVSVAGQLFGERGVANVSIPELMAAVGLTHGSFYWHFASKDDLACEACTRALAHEASIIRAQGTPSPTERQATTGPDPEQTPSTAIQPLASYALEALRAPKTSGLSAAYTAGLQDVIRAYGETRGPDGEPHAAIAAIATRVGTEILAKAVDERDLEHRIGVAMGHARNAA